MLVTRFHIHAHLSTLTSPMRMQSGALTHKGKAEVWSISRIILPASSFADVWVHLLQTCGGNWIGPHWLPEGPWVKLWQCTKVSLVMPLPICMHYNYYSSKVQEPSTCHKVRLLQRHPCPLSEDQTWEEGFRGALRWNGLPASIRASRSNDVIPRSIKSHLLTYSI